MSFRSSRIWPILLLACLIGGVGLIFLRRAKDARGANDEREPSGRIVREVAQRVARLEAREQQADQTVWAKETLARRCGVTFEKLWNAINSATNKLGVLASFPVPSVVLANWDKLEQLPHGIELRQTS